MTNIFAQNTIILNISERKKSWVAPIGILYKYSPLCWTLVHTWGRWPGRCCRKGGRRGSSPHPSIQANLSAGPGTLGTAGAPVISYNTVAIGYVNYCNYARLVCCHSSSRPTLLADCFAYRLLWIQGIPSFRTKPKHCNNWWGSSENITWSTKKQGQRQRQWQKHLENTFKELHIFNTFDHWDIWSEWWENMTWPKKDNHKDKY